MAFLFALYYGTSKTAGTFGTLFTPKTPKRVLKKVFLDHFFTSNSLKKYQNRPENICF